MAKLNLLQPLFLLLAYLAHGAIANDVTIANGEPFIMVSMDSTPLVEAGITQECFEQAVAAAVYSTSSLNAANAIDFILNFDCDDRRKLRGSEHQDRKLPCSNYCCNRCKQGLQGWAQSSWSQCCSVECDCRRREMEETGGIEEWVYDEQVGLPTHDRELRSRCPDTKKILKNVETAIEGAPMKRQRKAKKDKVAREFKKPSTKAQCLIQFDDPTQI